MENIVGTVLDNPVIYPLLSSADVKALTLTSKKISIPARAYLASNKTFTIKNEQQTTSMQWYSPRTFKHVLWAPSMTNADSLFKLCPYATHISFSDHYNDPIGKIPPDVLEMQFGKVFNHPLPLLPPKVTHLTFGNYFNKGLTDLPPSLTHLYFGRVYLQPLLDIPPSLTHLTLKNSHYAFPVPPLPNLQYLHVGVTSLKQAITADAFPKLTYLFASELYNLSFVPNNTFVYKEFGAYDDTPSFPPNLTYLCCGTYFNNPLNNLPSTITHLIFPSESRFDKPIDRLPTSITHLLLRRRFNTVITAFPSSLSHLAIEHLSPQQAHIPFTVSLIDFSCSFSFSPLGPQPLNLTYVTVTVYHAMFDTLPKTITHFAISELLCDANYIYPLPTHVQHFFIPSVVYFKLFRRGGNKDTTIKKIQTDPSTIIKPSRTSEHQPFFWDPEAVS